MWYYIFGLVIIKERKICIKVITKKLLPPPYKINKSSLRENSQNFRGNPNKKVDCFVAKDDNAPRNDRKPLTPCPLPLTKRLSIVLFGKVTRGEGKKCAFTCLEKPSRSNIKKQVNVHPSPTLPVQGERIITKKYPSGFSLAETLITLVIVGVIAAITVPSLINKTNNQETVSRLKKAYSTLSQATNQIIAEEGPITNWVTSPENVYNLYRKKLLNSKDCGEKSGCIQQRYKYLRTSNTERDWDNNSTFFKLISSDGSLIMVLPEPNFDSTCLKQANGSINICAYIVVDINGSKLPNIIGKDLFAFSLTPKGLFPTGCENISLCNKSELGWACACRVLREGAINY